MADKPTFGAFLRAFGARWFVLMSGPLGVPLTIIGAFVSTGLVQLGLAITAMAGVGFSTFWIWREERIARNNAETETAALKERLVPKLKCSFDAGIPGCVYHSPVTLNSVVPILAYWYRLYVENIGIDPAIECDARLRRLTKEGVITPLIAGEIVKLPFAPATAADQYAKEIRNTREEYLDFLVITEQNRALVRALDRSPGIAWDDMFSSYGDYLFEIGITSKNAGSVAVKIRFEWTGNFKTAKCSMIP